MALLNVDFYSYYLGMDSPLTVLLPEKRGRKPEAAPDKKYPVLYLLHGHADDNTAWIRKSDLELLVRDHDLIVVMPSAHRSFYTNGRYGHLYFDYITKELPVIVGNFFPASARRENTYIGGLSMGGYGALKAALSCPEQYAGVAAMSAANSPFGAMKAAGPMFSVPDFMDNVYRIFGDEAEYKGSKEDLEYLAKQAASSAGSGLKIYHSCGKQDPLYGLNVEFKQFMETECPELDYHYCECDGSHNWGFWNPQLKCILEYFGLIPASQDKSGT